METKKYICLLPTGGHQKGDIVEMTEEEFAGQNANEPEPRFEICEVVDTDQEGTSTETAIEQSSAEEGGEQSGEAESATTENDVATEGDKTPEETTTTEEGASSTEEGEETGEESTEEVTA